MQLLLYIYIYIFLKQRQVFLESQHVNWVSRGSLFADSLTRLTVELELPSLVEAGWGRGLWSQQAGCESRPCLWVLMWLWDKFFSVSGLTSPWIKGTMTGLTGSGAAGAGWGLQRHAQCGELSVALSLTHQLLVSMLTKPHVLLAVFFSEHLVPP